MTEGTVNVALLGAGRMGIEHARTLVGIPEVRVVAVADPNAEAAQAAQRLSRAERTYADPLDAIHDADVNAVVIVTPTGLHAAHIEAAARAGRAIFCEKPVATDLRETERVLRVVQETGVPFQIGFQRRYDPAFAQARARLDAGELGTIEQFHAVGRDPAPAPIEYLRGSGGIFLDQAIHDLDIARFLVGEVREVMAWGDAKVDPRIAELNDADTTTAVLHFENGAQGVVQNSRRAVYGYDVRTEVFGARGKFQLDATPKTPLLAYGDGVRMDHYHFFMDRFRDAYRLELEAFVRAVLGGTPPEPGARDALESLRLAVACQTSLRERRPVRLEELREPLPTRS